MNQKKKLGSVIAWLAALALVTNVLAAGALGCAGANGDPAPAAVEAGAPELAPCVDAGATE